MVKFLGKRTAVVNYNAATGDVFLNGFAIAAAGAISAAPEPAWLGLALVAAASLAFARRRG
jgi:hypothetical protein